ncbi:hypothetical protein JTE90_024209 [Oedothorax gibbosus]|uniref:Ionotropic glutamate receptor L-glutamate and glycine-binding domain-containing protein n=1 Tax=Oedothorax gibbosus TaxID=931172 RepID=A0AAV6U9H2_9ARAC|nr:hypothetical protein JTE90_024209 [Oedothorax gibbosus]
MFLKFLKIAFFPNPYLIIVQKNENNKTEITGGYEGLLLKDISQAIGFDYELLEPQDGKYGWRDSETGQWTGMLGMLDRGEVDFIFQKFAYGDDIFNHFSVIPFSSYRFTYATSKPTFESAESRFEMPFQAEVWIASVAVYLLLTVVLWILLFKTKLYTKEIACETLLNRRHKQRTNTKLRHHRSRLEKLVRSDHDNRGIKQVRRSDASKNANNRISFSDVAMQTLKIMLNQDSSSRYLKSASTKAVLITWMIGSMLLCYSYSGSLLSFMTLPSLNKPIETVEQLANAVDKHGYKLHVGSKEIVSLVIESNPLLVDTAVKIIKNDWILDYTGKGLPRNIEAKSVHVTNVDVLQLVYGVPPFSSAFISEDVIKFNSNTMFPKFLKIAFIPNTYLIIVQKNENNKTEITGGYEGRILKDIAQAIGFGYELFERQDGIYGWRDSETAQWTGMLGMLDRGEVDFIFQKFAYGDDIFNHFSVIPFSSYRFTYATSKPTVESAESRFEMPFQAEVWMASVAVYLLVTVVLFILLLKTKLYTKERAGETLLDRRRKQITNRKPRHQISQLGKLFRPDRYNRGIQQVRQLGVPVHANNRISFCDVAMQTLKILFNQDSTSLYLKSASTKAILITWMIGSMLLCYSYSGSLLSFMTLPSLSKPIETVEQLANAVDKHGFKLHVGQKEVVPLIIESNPFLVGAADKIIKNDWILDYTGKGLPRKIEAKSAHVLPVDVLQLAYGVPPFASAFISEDIVKRKWQAPSYLQGSEEGSSFALNGGNSFLNLK